MQEQTASTQVRPQALRQHRAANRRALSLPFGRWHARLLRLTRGRVAARWFGAPVLVLETVGRRTGARRATPVLYLRDGDAYVVLAANAGSDRTPAWWLNLRDAGEGAVLLGGRRVAVRPRLAEGAERDRLWAAFCDMYAMAEDYARLTDRPLPLVVLEPA
ncbi:MAG: nitroreductase family deazaflavin-dependent oxidoreductase [Solirubrobacterales bacterium]|nr:nitroreductase family deazaflavin-dependent oxidoreductase [Solirubrobacterales bacterium]